MQNGIFISYRRSYAHFAGRVSDYLKNKGLDPYMDVYRTPQDYYRDILKKKICECPYFLLVLSKDWNRNLRETDVFYEEIMTALNNKQPSEILLITDSAELLNSPDQMPAGLEKLLEHGCDVISHENFYADMQRFADKIDYDKLREVINWKERISKNGTVMVGPRTLLEKEYATMANRFGGELVDAVKQNKAYNGPRIIKRVSMSCYAASILFAPARDMVDDKAYDHGLLFNIFEELLKDPDFSMEIILNAPGSLGAQAAIDYEMLGNRALEQHPEAVFYSAYEGLTKLIEESPVFKTAYAKKRFRFYLTDVVMTGAIFQIEYKDGYDEFDHIKFDIYSYDLTSNMDRRSMVFFKSDSEDNYSHMRSAYDFLKKHRYSKSVISENHARWLKEWEELKEDID